MSPQALNPEQLYAATANSLGLQNGASRQSLAKAAIRRAASILAPASENQVIRFAATPLTFLSFDEAEWEAALEDLIVYGDILELHRLTSDGWSAPELVLRPAPPSFVKRSNGDFVILGIAGDAASPLTGDLDERLRDDGLIRRLRAADDEDLASRLKQHGLVAISENAWLRYPRTETADNFIAHWRAELARRGRSSTEVEGLQILESARKESFYPKRWVSPTSKHSGQFVGRRSKKYGAALWCIVELAEGVVSKLLDLFEDSFRQRPCDLAWRLQMAIDASAGTPQKVRLGRDEESAWMEVFAPLPAYAERRLALVGTRSRERGALFKYRMPECALAIEVETLKSVLWLQFEEG
jgi:hypothetical protein